MELHFASGEDRKRFVCSKCPEATQKARRCMGDSWENGGSPFPLKIVPYGADHYFCPAKIARDDYETAETLSQFWLSWKLGQVPNAPTVDMMTGEDTETLSAIIYHWEETARNRDYNILSKMLGGKA